MLYLQPQRNRAKIPTTPQKKTQKTCCLSISKKKHHPKKTRHQKIMLPPAFPPPPKKKKNPTQPTPTPFTHSHSHPPQKKKQKMIPLFSIHPVWKPWIFPALVWRTELLGDHQRDSQRVEGVEANAESFRTVSTLSRVLRATFSMGHFFGYGFFVKGLGKKNTRGWKRCESYTVFKCGWCMIMMMMMMMFFFKRDGRVYWNNMIIWHIISSIYIYTEVVLKKDC